MSSLTPVVSTPNVSSAPVANAGEQASSVSFFDLRPQHALLETPLRQAIERVVRNGEYILGSEVDRFEQLCCRELGVAHAVGVSCGSDALFLALLALGVGPGDEVVTTAFSFIATAEAIRRTGANPVLADIRPDDFCLCPESAERLITPQTKAIVFVHLFGNTGTIAATAEICQRHGIALVEDACQAFGAQAEHRAAGTWGRVGCFSFFPTKPLGGMGDGGLCVTDDPELAKHIRSLRVHGLGNQPTGTEVSGNFRLDALQAAILAVKLPEVERFRLARQHIARKYSDELGDFVALGLPRAPAGPLESVWSLYTIRELQDRDGLRAHLARHGVESRVYYPKMLSEHPAIAAHCRHDELTEASRATREVLSLPIYYGLSDTDQMRVITSIRKWLGR